MQMELKIEWETEREKWLPLVDLKKFIEFSLIIYGRELPGVKMAIIII